MEKTHLQNLERLRKYGNLVVTIIDVLRIENCSEDELDINIDKLIDSLEKRKST